LINNAVRRRVRAPIKHQALQVINQRGIQIGTVLDVGVLNGTPELKAHFPRALHMLFEPVVEFNAAIAQAYNGTRHEIANVAVSHETGETLLVSNGWSIFRGLSSRIATSPAKFRTARSTAGSR